MDSSPLSREPCDDGGPTERHSDMDTRPHFSSMHCDKRGKQMGYDMSQTFFVVFHL